jgi:hypothetical protein
MHKIMLEKIAKERRLIVRAAAAESNEHQPNNVRGSQSNTTFGFTCIARFERK